MSDADDTGGRADTGDSADPAAGGQGDPAAVPAFIAPEQVTGAEITAATDVFALGALLVYAATGTPPFGDAAAQVLYARVVHNEPSPGTELCLSPGTSISDLSGDPNINDHWVWMSSSTAPCT